LGAAATFVLIMLAYAFRDQLRRVWEVVERLLTRLQLGLEASADERYRALVAAWARSLIVPAHVAPLDALFIGPQLLAPSPTLQSAPETEYARAGRLVLPLRQILGDHPQLIILGAPGAGRTMTLAHLALACATIDAGGDGRGEAVEIPKTIRDRLPLYVLLSAMDWSEDEQEQDEQKSDGVSVLLKSAMASIEGSGGLSNIMRKYLEAGRAIVLADGWDELSPQQRQRVAAWLAELVGALPGNLWLVGAGTRDYALLTEAGFIPLTVAPWDTRQVEAFAKRCGILSTGIGAARVRDPFGPSAACRKSGAVQPRSGFAVVVRKRTGGATLVAGSISFNIGAGGARTPARETLNGQPRGDRGRD
jgi:hypothetical protein